MTREQGLALIAAILIAHEPPGMYDEDKMIEEAADLLGAAAAFIGREENNTPHPPPRVRPTWTCSNPGCLTVNEDLRDARATPTETCWKCGTARTAGRNVWGG